MYRFTKFTIILFLIFFASQKIFAVTHYVSKTGSNTPPYTNWATASASIQTAVYYAVEGSEIIVQTGNYFEGVVIYQTNLILRSTNPDDFSIVGKTIFYGIALEPFSKANIRGFSICHGNNGVSGGSADCVIEKNIIFNNSSYSLYNCAGTIQHNIITNNNRSLRNCAGTIQHNTISDNSDDGLYNCAGTIHNNIITNNSGYGLIQCDGTIKNNTISENSQTGLESCDGTIHNNIISANSENGGVSRCGGTIHNNIISNNLFFGLNDCNGNIHNNKIINNSNCGLLNCGGTIQFNTISGNSASLQGGGLYNCGTIEQNIISANTANDVGGGIYCSINSTIRNNLIVDNMSSVNGGGIYIYQATPQIQNNTIVRNFASSAGGGLYYYEHLDISIGLFNCILWGNIAGVGSQYDYYHRDSPVICHYSCIQNDAITNNCINENPLFVSANDFHLTINSPCVDMGMNLPNIFTWRDLDDKERVANSIVDMGCYEYDSIPEPNIFFGFSIILYSLFVTRKNKNMTKI